MDEQNYFVSLISELEKDISVSNWTFDNATSSSAIFTLSGYPFDNLAVNKIYLSTDSPKEFTLSLSASVMSGELDLEKGSICVSNFVYVPASTLILYLDIGFIVDGEEHYKRYSELKINNWEKISYTIDTLDNDAFVPFIRVNFNPDVDALEDEASLYFNGLSVGQWSEPHNSESTGIFPQSLPLNIENLLGYSGSLDINYVPLDPYGFNNELDSGYIVAINNSLLAALSGIPMVYGSSGNVKLTARQELSSLSIPMPSLIFPGKGFLNKTGYNKTLTTEFWLRISPETTSKEKIFGPLTSNDGIYVDRDFISINVGKYTKSYFIGKWYRPMLVHFCQSPTEIFLMINGEKVISIAIDSLNIETFTIEEADFLGFYTSENIYIYEIDCFSIFPYVVAEQVAKKRYVFGQGVQEQENIVAANNGTLSYIDFPFSGYSSTIRYPDRTRWDDGFYNNIIANSEGISLPSYELPQIIFNNETGISEYEKSLIHSNFYSENYFIQDEDYPFIYMDPDGSYIDSESYGTIYFSQLNRTSSITRSVFSILRASGDVDKRQSLLYISNSIDTNNFEIFINSGSVHYKFNDTVLKTESLDVDGYFVAGINLDKMAQNYGDTVGTFFSNTNMLSLNFAGNQNDTFLGKIFSLTMNNDFFTDNDVLEIFDSSGFAFQNSFSNMFNYIGSYTLLPKTSNTSMFLDIGASGYWENSIPLSYFGKDIVQSNGELKYDLDLIQFNIDSPTSVFSKYNLNSSLFQDSLSTRVYITMQEISQIGDFTYSTYTNNEVVGLNRVLDLGEVTGTNNTKFEINDGTIIYPPKDISGFTNYYITIHIEISSKGINTENVRIKNMGLSALSFNEGEFYSINTPATGKFYPIAKNEDQHVYKRNIPVVIDTESSPYLYLSGDSGVEVLPQPDGDLLKGISIPINESLKLGQSLVGFQMFLMFDEDALFLERRVVGKIFSSNNNYEIVLVPENDSKRAFLHIYDSNTGKQFITAKLFLNGKLVSDIVVEPLAWNCIVVSLQENSMNLDGIIAQLEVYAGVKIDNVASFMELDSPKQLLIAYDKWNFVDDELWDYWSASATWTHVLDERSLEIVVLSLDGEGIFNVYAGLSSGTVSDNSSISVSTDSIVILNDIAWTSYLV